MEFLESNRDLPRATSTSALSSASVFRLIGRMGDTVNKMTYKMEETDPWYEDKIVQLDHLELQLKKLYALTEALASSRRDLAIATGHFAASAAVLASTEDSNNLSRYGKGASINHVDGILDIFDPPPPLVDRHGFLANPP